MAMHLVFLSIIWQLWLGRNKHIFDGITLCADRIVAAAKSYSLQLHAAFNHERLKTRVPRLVGWEFPPQGTIKLNTDGSSKGNPGPSGSGGIFRDNSGSCLGGFTCNIGISTSIHAELWGIWTGFSLAWDMHIESLVVETDSELAIQLICNAHADLHPLGSLIEDCRDFISRNWTCHLCHTLREGNRCAGFMANISHDYTDSLKLFPDPPHVA